MTVLPDDSGRAAHDSQRALPASVSGPLYDRLARELGTGTVLDVGGGSGVIALALADAGCHVVLTDVVDWRSPLAQTLPFLEADAATLPVGAGTCSGVHMARVLHHVDDWRAVLTEAVRVLRDDGALCLSLGDRPVADGLRTLIDIGAERTGLVPAPVDGPEPAEADDHLSGLGWTRAGAFEFGADIPVTPREVLTGALGNPFRWAPGQDLAVVPKVVDEVLAGSPFPPDSPILRDRTVRYRVYRRG
ncbi:MAG TPA: class I SAM-dependent methyltransferase [Pseudonocardiaceae bacterium]|nr:class I SAM-dependent methyltransferase [Pseudonocardiaceae bacterium]